MRASVLGIGVGCGADRVAVCGLPIFRLAVPGHACGRTGDRCWRAPMASWSSWGAPDDQVKIRGYRIEPGEVATALAELAGVGQAVVNRP